MNMDISVVIPTKDRPDDLAECIDSVLGQELLPKEIIVVDDGLLSAEYIDQARKKVSLLNVGFNYSKENKLGLSVSRNLGAARAASDIVLFLDDDVILCKNYLSELSKVWREYSTDSKLAGVGGLISNLRRQSTPERIFHKLFFLSSDAAWDITDVGFQVWDGGVKTLQKAYYLPGGITSFRKPVLEKIKFEQFSPGRTPGDDVDFFLRAKKAGYYFFINPEAKVYHKEAPVARESMLERGIKEGYNQYQIFRVNADKTFKNILIFAISSIGWVLRQFLAFNFAKACGMVLGYLRAIFAGE